MSQGRSLVQGELVSELVLTVQVKLVLLLMLTAQVV